MKVSGSSNTDEAEEKEQIEYKPLTIEIEDTPPVEVPDIHFEHNPEEGEQEQEQEVLPPVANIEDLKMLSATAWNVPSLMWGAHLIVPEEKSDAFAFALQRYCDKKGIDIGEYIFDELGLVMAAAGIVIEMRSKHIEYQKEQEKIEALEPQREEEKIEEENEKRRVENIKREIKERKK